MIIRKYDNQDLTAKDYEKGYALLRLACIFKC